MCGRYALGRHRAASVFEREYFASLEGYRGHYNAAPTQSMPIARLTQGKPELIEARWGLVPAWAKDVKIAYSTINARAETVAIKPAFRSAYKVRGCLVPASGYYIRTQWDSRRFNRRSAYASAPSLITLRTLILD